MKTSRLAMPAGFKQFALPLLCFAFSAGAQAQAQAQSVGTQEALYARSLAATCANCHGTDGKAAKGSALTSLAGLDKGYIVAQMKAFKAGTRPATVMHQISKGFNDAQIESLATYFSAQKK
ncbi:c-type cytochrome [Polaromonas sp.]|uniref:c-type cytochrome n=1 Tax=Polaromonas sp. TaxID=1869339 RepID=UPI003266B5DB